MKSHFAGERTFLRNGDVNNVLLVVNFLSSLGTGLGLLGFYVIFVFGE